ncbi:hypothetical protein [Psychrobacillus psychrodurans]|uniref:hypothetical protein n=1 Tax=Psychrobacillus psychrodurans TaxID=126157 RepID=UPI0008F043AF|nr:hypothetical protein [Psychrobacillus psychrodurans]MCZ8541980.1 hypothetical protein [Psychrobacillus psychrodurans]SFN13802.1 hypothetical protein SAMN05421832_11638 [Psychrobacillus psychrodurans]
MIKLGELEPGTLFKKNGTYAIKSEYRNTKGTCESYIIGTGEMFWGGTGNPNALKVEPINFEGLIEQVEKIEILEKEKETFRRMITEDLKPVNVLLEKENQKLREEIQQYKSKYENTGSMFGRQAQRTLIDENKKLREALEEISKYDHDPYARRFALFAQRALEDNQ